MKKFRFIFITSVSTESIRNNTGLYKVFSSYKAMENAFINQYIFNKETKETKIIDTLLAINKNGGKFLNLTEESQDWDILLLPDSIDIDKYPEWIFNENTVVLHHTVPLNVKNTLQALKNAGRIKFFKQGIHGITPDSGYNLLVDLVKAYDENIKSFKEKEYDEVFEKIENFFGINEILESKLKLLHCIHDGTPLKEVKVDEILTTLYGTNLMDDITKAINGHAKYNNSNENHRQALIKLRDALLADEE